MLDMERKPLGKGDLVDWKEVEEMLYCYVF
jgi:hypothetical protein